MKGSYESSEGESSLLNDELLKDCSSFAALGGAAVVLTMSTRREPSKKGSIRPRSPGHVTIKEITPVIDPMEFTGEDPQVVLEILTSNGEKLDALPEAVVTNPKQWLYEAVDELIAKDQESLPSERAEDKVKKLKYLTAIAKKIWKENPGEDEELDFIFARLDRLRRQLFEGLEE